MIALWNYSHVTDKAIEAQAEALCQGHVAEAVACKPGQRRLKPAWRPLSWAVLRQENHAQVASDSRPDFGSHVPIEHWKVDDD